jgi:hypothetical protein
MRRRRPEQRVGAVSCLCLTSWAPIIEAGVPDGSERGVYGIGRARWQEFGRYEAKDGGPINLRKPPEGCGARRGHHGNSSESAKVVTAGAQSRWSLGQVGLHFAGLHVRIVHAEDREGVGGWRQSRESGVCALWPCQDSSLTLEDVVCGVWWEYRILACGTASSTSSLSSTVLLYLVSMPAAIHLGGRLPRLIAGVNLSFQQSTTVLNHSRTVKLSTAKLSTLGPTCRHVGRGWS